MKSLHNLGVGCGDAACIWGPASGMSTNGGCQCDESKKLSPMYVNTHNAKDFYKEHADMKQGIITLRVLAESPEIWLALEAMVRHVIDKRMEFIK